MKTIPKNLFIAVTNDGTGQVIHLDRCRAFSERDWRSNRFATDYGTFRVCVDPDCSDWRESAKDSAPGAAERKSGGLLFARRDEDGARHLHYFGLDPMGWQFPGMNVTLFLVSYQEELAWNRLRSFTPVSTIAHYFSVLHPTPDCRPEVCYYPHLLPWSLEQGPRPPRVETPGNVIPAAWYKPYFSRCCEELCECECSRACACV